MVVKRLVVAVIITMYLMGLEFYMNCRKEHRSVSVQWCSCENAGCRGAQVK